MTWYELQTARWAILIERGWRFVGQGFGTETWVGLGMVRGQDESTAFAVPKSDGFRKIHTKLLTMAEEHDKKNPGQVD